VVVGFGYLPVTNPPQSQSLHRFPSTCSRSAADGSSRSGIVSSKCVKGGNPVPVNADIVSIVLRRRLGQAKCRRLILEMRVQLAMIGASRKARNRSRRYRCGTDRGGTTPRFGPRRRARPPRYGASRCSSAEARGGTWTCIPTAPMLSMRMRRPRCTTAGHGASPAGARPFVDGDGAWRYYNERAGDGQVPSPAAHHLRFFLWSTTATMASTTVATAMTASVIRPAHSARTLRAAPPR
jgi:hypothetical protein